MLYSVSDFSYELHAYLVISPDLYRLGRILAHNHHLLGWPGVVWLGVIATGWILSVPLSVPTLLGVHATCLFSTARRHNEERRKWQGPRTALDTTWRPTLLPEDVSSILDSCSANSNTTVTSRGREREEEAEGLKASPCIESIVVSRIFSSDKEISGVIGAIFKKCWHLLGTPLHTDDLPLDGGAKIPLKRPLDKVSSFTKITLLKALAVVAYPLPLCL